MKYDFPYFKIQGENKPEIIEVEKLNKKSDLPEQKEEKYYKPKVLAINKNTVYRNYYVPKAMEIKKVKDLYNYHKPVSHKIEKTPIDKELEKYYGVKTIPLKPYDRTAILASGIHNVGDLIDRNIRLNDPDRNADEAFELFYEKYKESLLKPSKKEEVELKEATKKDFKKGTADKFKKAKRYYTDIIAKKKIEERGKKYTDALKSSLEKPLVRPVKVSSRLPFSRTVKSAPYPPRYELGNFNTTPEHEAMTTQLPETPKKRVTSYLETKRGDDSYTEKLIEETKGKTPKPGLKSDPEIEHIRKLKERLGIKIDPEKPEPGLKSDPSMESKEEETQQEIYDDLLIRLERLKIDPPGTAIDLPQNLPLLKEEELEKVKKLDTKTWRTNRSNYFRRLMKGEQSLTNFETLDEYRFTIQSDVLIDLLQGKAYNLPKHIVIDTTKRARHTIKPVLKNIESVIKAIVKVKETPSTVKPAAIEEEI